MSVTPEGGPWLTVGEVAALLKVHPNTVRRLILGGDLPAVRLGGRRGSPVRIATDDLHTFMHQSRIQAGAEPTPTPTPIGTGTADTAGADL
jgi:excisionase family DNA binding protein